MSRRALGTVAITGALLAIASVPFLGSAQAAACPSWTDPAGDAAPFALPFIGAAGDAGLDIVGASITNTAGDVTGIVKVKTLGATKAGDRFAVQVNAGGQNLLLYAIRPASGAPTAGVQNLTDSTAAKGAASAVFDTAASTVAITAKQGELDKAAGRSVAGAVATAASATTQIQANDQAPVPYDGAPAPANTTVKLGTACGDGGGDPGPSGSPTPTPTGSPAPGLPAGYPTAGCNTATDITNDAQPVIQGQKLDSDPDLDFTGFAINTTDTDLKAYLRINKLAMPKNGVGGHDFALKFTVNAKAVTLHVGEFDTEQKTANSAATPNYGEIGTTKNADLTPAATFDKTNNIVIVSVPLAKVATATAGTFAEGTKLTAVSVASQLIYSPTLDKAPADTAQAAADADRVYTLGDSPCFGPAPGKLANTGKTTVQYTDAAAVAATLTDAKDNPLEGKTLTFAIGTKTVSATTGPDGVAHASLNPGVVAGSYTLVTSYAGDPKDAAKVSISTPFTVTVEKTKIVLSVVKSGTKRTVTAKLVDDDGHPVAGQTIAWYVNGKKVASAKTGSAGTVKLTTAKPTQTVKAVFTAVTGKYAGATASQKV
jgi:hypothetical protein